MEIYIEKDSHLASVKAAESIKKLLYRKPNAVLGLATGSTPLDMYRVLIDQQHRKEISFAQVITFNLDEYVGLPTSDKNSYRSFMDENFFNHIDIDKSCTHVLDGMSKNIATTCDNYEHAIKDAGGIDLQVLGLGADAHIGFNEPMSSFKSRTRLEKLNPKTISDNARFFDGDESKVPTQAITMGIDTIMDAKSIVLLAFGANKADAVLAMLEGQVTESVPASILQRHPNAKIFLDEAAASKLTRK